METDAPDLLPHNLVDDASSFVVESRPLNEPANLRHVLAKAAELRGVSEEALASSPSSMRNGFSGRDQPPLRSY